MDILGRDVLVDIPDLEQRRKCFKNLGDEHGDTERQRTILYCLVELSQSVVSSSLWGSMTLLGLFDLGASIIRYAVLERLPKQ